MRRRTLAGLVGGVVVGAALVVFVGVPVVRGPAVRARYAARLTTQPYQCGRILTPSFLAGPGPEMTPGESPVFAPVTDPAMEARWAGRTGALELLDVTPFADAVKIGRFRADTGEVLVMTSSVAPRSVSC